MDKNAAEGSYEEKRAQRPESPIFAPRLTGGTPKRPSKAAALDSLADMIGELAATLERAHELPGRMADAQRLRYRLLLREAEIDRRERRLQAEVALARGTGREFIARRLAAELHALEEERFDAAAMLSEVDRVLQRLRRERRSLLYRLECGEALVAAFPPGRKKATLGDMLEEARRSLVPRRLVAIGDQ